MPSPRSYVLSRGEWPLGPFDESIAGRAARRQGEYAWLVRFQRGKLGWSQQRLADELGISRSAIAELETGRDWTGTQVLWLVAEVLNLHTTPEQFKREWPDGPPT